MGDNSHSRKPRELPFVLYVSNIILATVAAVICLSLAVDFTLAGLSGSVSEKVSSALIITSTLASAALIVRQSMKSAGPVGLAFCTVAAALCALGLKLSAQYLLPASLGVDQVLGSQIIDVSLASCSFYLLLWERGRRLDLGANDLMEAIMGICALWPMVLVYSLIIGVEFLT